MQALRNEWTQMYFILSMAVQHSHDGIVTFNQALEG